MQMWLETEEAKAICRHRAITNQYIQKRMNQGIQVPKAEWMHWAHEYDAAQKIIRSLAQSCDGAKQEDNVGFNKHDAQAGKQLARLEKWTNEQFWQAVRIARKYKRQARPEWYAWLPMKAAA